MTKVLSQSLGEYSLDELAKRVEGGSDSDAQKAEPILIAKSNMILVNYIKDSIQVLSLNVNEMGKKVDKFEGSINVINNSINNLSTEIDRAAKESSKQAKSLSMYTLLLAIATFVLAFGAIWPLFIK